KQICMSKNDISEDTLQNITKGVTFSQSISSIFRVTFSLAVDSRPAGDLASGKQPFASRLT
ncbi:MAG: hypothetical protein WBH65_06970, partial [Dethiobacteria bacterium]